MFEEKTTVDAIRSLRGRGNTAAQRRGYFALIGKCLTMFGIVNAIVIGALTVLLILGDPSSVFMWVRGLIMVAVAPALWWMARRAERGSEAALGRIRVISVILPIAIVGVDLIPGICPIWYAGLQGVAALSIVPVAVLSRRLGVRTTSH